MATARFDKDDVFKLDFVERALDDVDPFSTRTEVHADSKRALAWLAGKSPDDVLHQRDCIMQQMEAEADALWYARWAWASRRRCRPFVPGQAKRLV